METIYQYKSICDVTWVRYGSTTPNIVPGDVVASVAHGIGPPPLREPTLTPPHCPHDAPSATFLSMENATNPRNHAVANTSTTNAFVAFGRTIRESLGLAGKRGDCLTREKNFFAL